ncbi:MAG: hypothetical protein ACK463_03625, partial [Bradyrhizobium sp.]
LPRNGADERLLAAKAGTMTLGDEMLPAGQPVKRAASGIARTFQTPRVIGEASVLENVMIGGSIEGRANFVEAMLALPRNGADERLLAAKAGTMTLGDEMLPAGQPVKRAASGIARTFQTPRV